MTEAVELITKLAAVFATGAALGGIIYKFFERVETVLTDQTKFEIAVWIVGRKMIGPKIAPWFKTLSSLSDSVFGPQISSWRAFRVSCLISLSVLTVTGILMHWPGMSMRLLWGIAIFISLGPDYLSVVETRYLIRLAAERRFSPLLLVVVDLLATALIAYVAILVTTLAVSHDALTSKEGVLRVIRRYFTVRNPAFLIWFFPAYATSVWLWLHAGAGRLLKTARRFDVGFDWFSRRFDIERKPLQSIGLVAGALVTFLYWAAVIAASLF